MCIPQLTRDVCEDLTMDMREMIFSARAAKCRARNVKNSEAAKLHSKLDLPCLPDPLLGQEEDGPQEDEDVGLFPPPYPRIDPSKMSQTQHPLLFDASQHPEDPHDSSSFSGSDTEKSWNGFV